MFSQPDKNLEQFHVDPGMVVVDLGAGTGHYSFILSDRVGETGMVYAIDVQKELVEKIRNEALHQNKTNIKPIWGDIEEPEGVALGDGIADRVVISNTLFQVDDKIGLIREAYRLLKPKGKVLFVDWEDSYGGLGPHTDEVVDEEKSLKMFQENGFEVERKIEAGDHHYGIIFRVNK